MPTCRVALQESWANLVRAPMPGERRVLTIPLIGAAPKVRAGAARSPQQDDAPAQTPTSDPLAGELEQLAQLCAGDRVALNDIGLLRAMRLRDLGDAGRALALLAQVDARPGDRAFGLYHGELLKAHTEAGSIAEALPQILDRHEALLLDGGLQAEPPFTVGGIAFRAYRQASPGQGWLLIGLRPNGEIESIVVGIPDWVQQYGFQDEVPPFDLSNARCSTSGQFFEDGDASFDETMTLDRIIGILEANFANPEREGNWDDLTGVPDFCPNLADMLPGFGRQVEFTGAEYRDRSLGFTEQDLLLVLQSEDPEARSEAVEYLFDHPQTVEPIHLIYGIVNLIQQGDMERATFWYYIWQTRTRPWMVSDSSTAQLRGALGASIGPQLMEWVASDYGAMLDLWRRAIRYELRFPLHASRPRGVSAEVWAERVAAAREQNSEENMLGNLLTPEEVAAVRTSNGLANGPWQSPGRPLKDGWR